MMTAVFGDETASSISRLSSPANAFSQESGEAVDSAGGEQGGEAAHLLGADPPVLQPHPHHPGQQPQQRGWPAVLARWPSGDEPPSARPDGGATVAWRDQSHNKIEAGDVRMGRTRAGEAAAPPDDPFSIVGTPGLGGGRGAGEYDPLPAISESDRRDWNLRSTKPTANLTGTNVESGVAGGAGGGAGGWGGGLMPPRWVPDEEGVACVGCGKDFDWARRRHHCRACGRLYCYACSRFRALLPRSFGTRDPQRLCQPCNARVAPLQEMLVDSVSNAVKENDVEQGGMASYLNRPIVFTLGAEVRKAAYTIHNFTKGGVIQDRSIPQELLGRAKGLAFLTVIKGGFIVAGRVGTGLVVARTEEGVWSAPSAIATMGLGWGALIGGEITDFVLVLNTESAVEAFSGRGQMSIGAELSVAVGPVGRTGAGNVSVAAEGIAHAYSYSHSRGLFAGLSLEGGVIMTRPDVNRKFYGREVSVRDLLSGSVAPPPAARPLYEALEHRGPAAEQQSLLSQGFRVG